VSRTRKLLVGILAVTVLAVLPSTASAGLREEMLGAINVQRMAHGVPPLRHSPFLHSSSYGYARYLMRIDRFGHAGSSSFGELLEIHGGRAAYVKRTVRLWMRSPGHRRLLLSHTYRRAGVGMTSGRFQGARRSIWVARLGR
jgi:uncharacterized protein YkwD